MSPRQPATSGTPVACPSCRDSGHVCENHPARPWAPLVDDSADACDCGAGMPCPSCRGPAGVRRITDAFRSGASKT